MLTIQSGPGPGSHLQKRKENLMSHVGEPPHGGFHPHGNPHGVPTWRGFPPMGTLGATPFWKCIRTTAVAQIQK